MKDTIPSKSLPQKWKRCQDFPRYTKEFITMRFALSDKRALQVEMKSC